MNISWNTDPSIILEKIEALKNLNDKGNAQFSGWGFTLYKTLLCRLIKTNIELPEYIRKQLVSNSLFSCGRTGPITSKRLISEINKQYLLINKIPARDLVLFSTISVDKSTKNLKYSFEDIDVLISSKIPKVFVVESNKIRDFAKKEIFGDIDPSYSYLRLFVKANTVHTAATIATDYFDASRGVLNFLLNVKEGFRFTFGGKPTSINKIILGPIHTVHNSSGNLADENYYWYEQSYLGPIKPLKINPEDLFDLKKKFNKILLVLKNHKYKKDLINAFMRYARALDERNHQAGFLKLWGVLEFLTDTIGQSYDTAVRRVAFLFRERDYQYQVLSLLKDFRNDAVHHDKGESEIETYLYQLKHYIEALLRFHLFSEIRFNSIQDAASFLNLTYNYEDLLVCEEKIKYAKKIRKK